MSKFDKRIKRMGLQEVQLTKFSVASSTLFLITVWPAALELVQSIHWGWFLAAAIVFAILPVKKVFS